MLKDRIIAKKDEEIAKMKEEIRKLLEHTEQEKIFSFIAEYAAEDNCFYEKIKKTLLPDDNEEFCDIDYYREIANDCFDFDAPYYRGRRSYNYDFHEAAYRAASGLDNLLSDASFLAEQRKYADAAATAMAVAEVIPRNYEEVDDSGGGLGDTFNMAIELLCNIVNNAGAAVSVKKEIYSWSMQEIGNSVYSDYGFDEIKIIYETCCEQLGDTDEVLADIDRQIESATHEYSKTEAVLRKIRFMKARNMDIQGVLQTYLDLEKVRKIKLELLMNDKNYDEALLLANEGIEIAQRQNNQGTIIGWQKSMFDIYLLKGDTARLLPLAMYLFHHAGWHYNREDFYNALKEYTPVADWPDTLERLLAPAESGSGFNSFAARIMHEHRMWQRLFTLCRKGDIAVMEQYENDLKPYFEKEILKCYHDCVEKRALVTEARAYEAVARTLKRMRTFAGGDEQVNQLLEKYRATYKRRKNMMAALKGV
jgi:hypothetical protein